MAPSRILSRTAASRRGLTIGEIVVLAIVILLLIGMAVPANSGGCSRRRSRLPKAHMDMQTMSVALSTFRAVNKCYPPHRLEDLAPFAVQWDGKQCLKDGSAPTVAIVGTSDPGKDALYNTNRILVRFLTSDNKGPYMTIKQSDRKQDGQFKLSNGGSLFDCREQLSSPPTAAAPAFLFLDPWGNPYIYHNNADRPSVGIGYTPHNKDSFDLYSTGPDGVSASGGEDADDINNWGGNRN